MYSLNSYTFMDRLFFNVLAILLALSHIRKVEKNQFFTLLRSGDLKTLTTTAALFGTFVILINDIIAIWLKYSNGYVLLNNRWTEKPITDYVGLSFILVGPLNILFDFALVIKGSTLFLMMAIWNQNTKALFKDMLLTLDKESKAYILAAALTLLMFPIIIVITSFLPMDMAGTLTTSYYVGIIYIFQASVLSVLCLLMKHRFVKMLASVPRCSAAIRISTYIKAMGFLFISLLFQAVTLSLLIVVYTDASVISGVSESGPLPLGGYGVNVLAKLFNFSYVISFISAIYILYPTDLVHFKASVPSNMIKKEFDSLDPSKCINVAV